MPFNFSAKKAFLTYAQCPVSPADAIAILEQRKPLTSYIICQEEHAEADAEGAHGLHLHVGLIFTTKLQTRNERYFDLVVGGTTYHPNWQSLKSTKGTYTYLHKSPIGEVLEKDWPQTKPNPYAKALESETKEEFLQSIRDSDPRSYCLNLERLEYCANRIYQTPIPDYTPRFDEFDTPPEVLDWVNTYLVKPRPDRPKSLCIIGPSRTGKTEWARSLGSHIYWNGYTDYSSFPINDPTISYIVLDDISIQSVGRTWKCILGAQQSFIATDKYCRKKNIVNWGNPAIWVINKDMDPHNSCTGEEMQWMYLNVTFVYLGDRRFY